MAKRRKDTSVVSGALSWSDIQAMGALSVMLDLLARAAKKQRKKPEKPKGNFGFRPRPKDDSRFLEMKPTTGQAKAPEQEMSREDMAKEMQKLQQAATEVKPGKPTTKGSPAKYKLFDYGVTGNAPGLLVNAEQPDQLAMMPRRKARNMHRRKELEGALPKHWQRWPIDQKIFAGAMVKGGKINSRGSVLVDLSGSMSWTVDDINLMLDNLPEGTVYGYSGGGALSGGWNQGRWIILADRGRAVPAELVHEWMSYNGCNNIVDIPCLEFLANLPGPRFWISDTQVTGVGGFTRDLWDKAMKVCEDHSILPIRHAKQLADYMRTGIVRERPKWTGRYRTVEWLPV